MKERFSSFHPIVNITYFMVVLLITMFLMHPVIICISLLNGFIYLIHLKGIKHAFARVRMLFAMCLLVALINPLFNHQGMTILAYLKHNNPLTLESIVYGFIMAGLLFAVIVWFQCYNDIMTSDKFIYLFGRVAPHLSLLISMSIRYTTRFRVQMKQIREAQKGIGKDFSQDNIIDRVRNFVDVMSIMISWSMENSIETADSMKSRGYGLTGRTAFSIYRFDRRDGLVLGLILTFALCFIATVMRGGLSYRYFPTCKMELLQTQSIIAYLLFMGISSLPIGIDIYEVIKWKYLQQSI